MTLSEQQKYANQQLPHLAGEFPEAPSLVELELKASIPADSLASLASELGLRQNTARVGIVYATRQHVVIASQAGFLADALALDVAYEQITEWNMQSTEAVVRFVCRGKSYQGTLKAHGPEGQTTWPSLCLRIALRRRGVLRGEEWPAVLSLNLAAKVLTVATEIRELGAHFPNDAEVAAWNALLCLAEDQPDKALSNLQPHRRFPSYVSLLPSLTLMRLGQCEAVSALAPHSACTSAEKLRQSIRALAAAHSGFRISAPASASHPASADPGFWGSPSADFGFLRSFPLDSTTALAYQLTDSFQRLLTIWQALENRQPDEAEKLFHTTRQRADLIPLETVRIEAALLTARGDYLGAYELLSGTPGFRPFFPLCRLAVFLGRESRIADYVMKRFSGLSDPLDRFWAVEVLLAAGHHDFIKQWLTGSEQSHAGISREWMQTFAMHAESTNPDDHQPMPFCRLIEQHAFQPSTAAWRSSLQRWCRAILLRKPIAEWHRLLADSVAKMFEFPFEERLASAHTPSGSDTADYTTCTVARLYSDELRSAVIASAADPHEIGEYDQSALDAQLPLQLAVMGEFNAGKSTLINALLGTAALPRGNLPTTPLPCTLRYGEYPLAVLVSTDGRRQYVSTEQISMLFSSNVDSSNTGDSRNVQDYDRRHLLPMPLRNIREIEIILPIPLLKQIWIIDTPGLNSGNTSHQQATEALVCRADAVLWVFDANQAGRASELTAMRRLVPAHAVRVIAVNRIDEIDREEVDEVVEDIRRAIQDDSLPLFPVSAKRAVAGNEIASDSDSGLSKLLKHLTFMVSDNHSSLKEKSSRTRLRLLLEKHRDRQLNARERLSTCPADLKQAINAVSRAMQERIAGWISKNEHRVRGDLEQFRAAWQMAWQQAAGGEQIHLMRECVDALIHRLQTTFAPLLPDLDVAIALSSDEIDRLARLHGQALPPSAEEDFHVLSREMRRQLQQIPESLFQSSLPQALAETVPRSADIFATLIKTVEAGACASPTSNLLYHLWASLFSARAAWHQERVMNPLELALAQLNNESSV